MSKNRKESFTLLEGHRYPQTRREFLQHGWIPFAALACFPSLPATARGIFSPDTEGREFKNTVPFLVIDCAGGAALPANFLVGTKDGPEALLKNYDLLGWDPHTESIDTQFGLPMAAHSSQIRRGILLSTTPEARARFRMGSFCHFADSDTPFNPLSAYALAVRAGCKGKLLEKGVGTRVSDSGGNSEAAGGSPADKPLNISSVDDLIQNVSLSLPPFSDLSQNRLKTLFKMASKVSATQTSAFETSLEGQTLKKSLETSYLENENNVGTSGLDARKDPLFKKIFQIDDNTAANHQDAVFATAVRALLHRQTGPTVLTISQCDYHDNTSTTGDAKDLEIGMTIGRAVQSAYELKQPLFFQLLTDGGCANLKGTRIWRSDANDKCMTVIGLYQPNGAPQQNRKQIGYYTEGQGAAKDGAAGLGNSPYKTACAVFANYLSLYYSGFALMQEFTKVVPQNPFADLKELQEILVFET